MSTKEDINALLGIAPDAIVHQSHNIKRELAMVDSNHLEEKIISETNDIMDTTKNALEAVLVVVQTTPGDAELIEAASSLVKAQTGLIDALSKLHLSKEKHKQQVELTQMRIAADQQMNTENNQTRMLLSREEIMARLMNDAKKIDIIDIEPTI
ncbi:MAG: hypothetical protein IJ341_12515 [Bacteroidales bacterium]|nr:hypothetical protein [Bacteroidales bacterium]